MRSSAWVRCSTAQCRSEKPLVSRMRGPVCSTRRHISSTSGPLTASKACAAGVAGAAAAGGADAIAGLARTEAAADVRNLHLLSQSAGGAARRTTMDEWGVSAAAAEEAKEKENASPAPASAAPAQSSEAAGGWWGWLSKTVPRLLSIP